MSCRAEDSGRTNSRAPSNDVEGHGSYDWMQALFPFDFSSSIPQNQAPGALCQTAASNSVSTDTPEFDHYASSPSRSISMRSGVVIEGPSTSGEEEYVGPKLTLDAGSRPLRIYLAVDARKRAKLMRFLKARGARLVCRIHECDFALLTPGTVNHKRTLSRVLEAGKPALNTSWVESCINAEALMCLDRFSLQKGRARSGSKLRLLRQ